MQIQLKSHLRNFSKRENMRGMTIDQIREKLSDMDTNALKSLSDKSGVPWKTLYNIKAGITQRPNFETMDSLRKVLTPTKKRKGKAKN